MSDRDFDVVIIGAGLGGLESAIMLAREGYKVCVLEKNHQLGGSLQVFSRDKTIFDTGVHYIGGLCPGQNLHTYLNYFGIMDKLKLHRMDMDGFDRIELPGDPTQYAYAQGYENFVERLAQDFPTERPAIQKFCDLIREVCERFPLYRVRYDEKPDWMNDELSWNAETVIASLTDNLTLRNVLGGSNPLYAGDHRSPFYVHALVVNTYIESSWRCIDGGSQFAKYLASNARKEGAVIHSRKHVVGFDMDLNGVQAVRTADGDVYRCKHCIANIHPALVLDLVGEGHFRPAYTNRIRSLDETISSFTLHLVMKPHAFPYLDHNIYHSFVDNVWDGVQKSHDPWPSGYMFTTPMSSKAVGYADAITIMTYMRFSEWEQWAGSSSTIAEPGERGPGYEEFKHKKERELLAVVEQRFPGLSQGVVAMHSSTPITFRDYIGSPTGSMYGIHKNSSDPMRTFIAPRTKVPNLLLTGQNLNLHGLLGVTVSAVSTCGELVGKRYLVDRITSAS